MCRENEILFPLSQGERKKWSVSRGKNRTHPLPQGEREGAASTSPGADREIINAMSPGRTGTRSRQCFAAVGVSQPSVCWGSAMIRPSAALVLGGVAISVAALAGCADKSPPPEGQPTFYRDLAQPDVTVDAAAAQSMISGYRGNNGLGASPSIPS